MLTSSPLLSSPRLASPRLASDRWTRFYRLLLVSLLASASMACPDPPATGTVILVMESLPTDGTPLEGLTGLRFDVRRVEVVHRSDPNDSSTEDVLTVLNERTLIEIDGFVPGVEVEVARFQVPAGFVSQIRIIVTARTGGVEAIFATESAPFVLPSGDRTGLKVVAPESDPFPVTEGELTGVKVLFDAADRVVGNRGVGLLLKPTVPGVAADPAALLGAVPDQLLVAFEAGTPTMQMDDAHSDIGAAIIHGLRPTFHLVDLPDQLTLAEAAEAYLSRRDVKFVSPNWIEHITVTPRDLFPNQNFDLINAEAAWDLTRDGRPIVGDRRIVVAVLDSGAQLRHLDIVPQLWIDETELPSECTADVFPVDGCKDCDIDCRFEVEGRLLNGEPIVGDGIITMRDFNLWREEALDLDNRAILRELPRFALDRAGIRDCWPTFPPPLPTPPLVLFPDPDPLIDGLDLLNSDPLRTDCGIRDGIDNDGIGFPDALFGRNFFPDPNILIEDTGAAAYLGYGLADFALPWDDNSPSVLDPLGFHGTGMAGIIGGATDNFRWNMFAGQLPVGLAGVAWEVRLMIVKVCDEVGECNFDARLRGVDFALEHGADIVSMSFGLQGAVAELIPDPGDPNFTSTCLPPVNGGAVIRLADSEALRKWAASFALCWREMGFDSVSDVAFFSAVGNCPMSTGSVFVDGDRIRDVSIDADAVSVAASFAFDNLAAVAGSLGGSAVAGLSAFGPTVELAAPTGHAVLLSGQEGRNTGSVAGGSSGPTAMVAGTAVLVKSACTALDLNGPALIDLLIAGAQLGVLTDEEVSDGRLLDALGAVEAALALPGCN